MTTTASQFDRLRAMLDESLGLNGRALTFTHQTQLLGVLPEFDSMAAASVLTSIEETFGVVVDDDEVDGAVFETVGSLWAFVERKLS